MVETMFCQAGGFSANGRYVIGIFTSEYYAKQFAKVVKYRTENEIEVYVGERAIDVSGILGDL